MTARFRAPPLAMIATIVVVAMLAPAAARATPCDSIDGGLFQGPVGVGLYDGDHGVARRACPRTEVGMGVAAQATLEPDKYGLELVIQVASGSPIHIRGGVRTFGSVAIGRRLEVFGSFEPVHVRYLISGYQASHIGLGHTTMGATFVVYEDDVLAVAVTQSTTLPSALGLYRNAWPFAFDSGVTSVFSPFEFVALHAQLSGLAQVAYTMGNPDPRVGLLAAAGGEAILLDWVSFVVDAQAIGLYRAPLDAFSVATALRAKIFAGLAVEAALVLPLVGADRNLLATRFSLAYRF